MLTHLFCFGKLVARVITHKKFPDIVCDPDVDFDNQTDFVLFVTIDFTHYSNVLYKSLRLKSQTENKHYAVEYFAARPTAAPSEAA